MVVWTPVISKLLYHVGVLHLCYWFRVLRAYNYTPATIVPAVQIV